MRKPANRIILCGFGLQVGDPATSPLLLAPFFTKGQKRTKRSKDVVYLPPKKQIIFYPRLGDFGPGPSPAGRREVRRLLDINLCYLRFPPPLMLPEKQKAEKQKER